MPNRSPTMFSSSRRRRDAHLFGELDDGLAVRRARAGADRRCAFRDSQAACRANAPTHRRTLRPRARRDRLSRRRLLGTAFLGFFAASAKCRHFVGDDLNAFFADFHLAFDINRIVGAEQLGAFLIRFRPDDHFDEAGFVFEIETAVAITLLGVAQAQRRDHAAEPDFARTGRFSLSAAMVPLVIFLSTRSYLSSG